MIIIIVGIVPLILLDTVVLNVAEDSFINTRSKNLNAQFSILCNYISDEYSEEKITDDNIDLAADELAGIFMNRIQIIDNNFYILSDTYQINKGKICISEDVNKCFYGVNQTQIDKKNRYINFTQGIKDENGNIQFVVMGSASISDIFDSMHNVMLIAIAVVVILVVVLIAAAIYGSAKIVKPFVNINDAVSKINTTGQDEQVDIKGCTELENISNSFNLMLNKINSLTKSRQDFVSNVSHELKTPITSMKVLAESLIGQEGVQEELYQEFLVDIVGELDRENEIISDLLTLAKMDQNKMVLNIENTNINELVESILKIMKPLAKEKNIELVFETFKPVFAEVDKTKFSMCITNLVVNAIKYNNVDGWVHVSLNSDQTYFYLKVQDNGYGIPEESLNHVFDRFYRTDSARDRATGGSGLGLSITQGIVAAHKGTIKVHSELDVGSTFTMQVPLTYV